MDQLVTLTYLSLGATHGLKILSAKALVIIYSTIMRLHRNIHLLLSFLTCLLPMPDLIAQSQGSADPVVNQIKVQFQGFQPVSDQYVRGNVQ